MNWKNFGLAILIIIIVILVVRYSISLFLWIRNESMFRIASESMTHDSSTPVKHYQYLQYHFNYSKEQVDAWPINNGFKKGSIILVKKIECSDIKVGDVIVYSIGQGMNPIAHRVIQIKPNCDFVIKADHNPGIDPWKPVEIYGKVISVIL